MKFKTSHILSTLWQYLNQPLFNSNSKVVPKPT